MKQNTTNTFADGLNYDLHPIVTPNSVLTDNLNGTFITYNGNEFCLQNDRGNVLRATLSEGFVPIGIKEHNGVLYIVSHNKDKNDIIELGTYPGINWDSKKEVEQTFIDKYTPLKNLIKNPVYNTKNVKYVKCFASRWWPLELDDEYMIQIFNSTYGGLLDELVNNYGYTYDSSDLQHPTIKEFLRVIYTQPSDGAFYTLMEDVAAGTRFCDKNGKSPISLVNEYEGRKTYRCWSCFYGDETDFEDFQTYFYPTIEDINAYCNYKVILYIRGDITDPKYWNYQQLYRKLNFSKMDFYKLFSYSGLILSYDYPYNGTGTEWKASEINEYLELLFDIGAEHLGYDSFNPDRLFKHCFENVEEISTGVINWDLTEFDVFRTDKFGFTRKNPVEIEIQDSYDGSVNLILTDGEQKPFIINTEFSVNGDKYKLIKRTLKDYLIDASLVSQTSLINSPVSFSYFLLNDVGTGGALKGGNYTFYAKLGDVDGNQTDIVAESGIVSIFQGNVDDPTTIYGTLANERTDKSIRLQLRNISDGYSRVYLYYVREYSDTEGYLMEEAGMLAKPFNVISSGVNYCDITFTGNEDVTSISIEDLNITYHTVESVKTLAQQQNLLFCGNCVQTSYDVNKFDKFAKQIMTCISNITNDDTDTLTPVSADYSTLGDYYDVQNIYSKVGYWPGEYYRFGVVFILANGQNSPVFNMNGGTVTMDVPKKTFSDSAANKYGIFLLPKQTNKTKIINTSSTNPWHFKFNCGAMINTIINEGYADIIKGYFIVRQKRIPEVITQGLQVNIDSLAHVPILPWITENDEKKLVLESFVDNNLQLTYHPEGVDGAYLRPNSAYRKAVRITLNGYLPPDLPWAHQEIPIVLIGLMLLFHDYTERISTTLYMILKYDENGQLTDYDIQRSNPGEYDIIGNYNYWFNYDKYHNGYADITSVNDVWVNNVTSSGPGGIEYSDYYYSGNWNTLIQDIIDNKDISIGATIVANYLTDTSHVDTGDIDYFRDHLIEGSKDDNVSALLSLEPVLVSAVRNKLNGQTVQYEPIINGTCLAGDTANIAGRHQSLVRYSNTNLSDTSCQAVYVNSGNTGKSIGQHVFSTQIGNASDPSQIATAEITTDPDSDRRNVVRGKFTPYVGLITPLNRDVTSDMNIPIVQLALRRSVGENIIIRSQDSSPYYCVSKRCNILTDTSVDVYRGDCFVVTETIRINYNFIDPTYPITENILKPDCWNHYYRKGQDPENPISGDVSTKWDEINVTDLNTVSLGHWITFKCLASSNIGLRAPDPFDTKAMNEIGNAKSFYPLTGNVSTYGKQMESELFNSGYGITTGQVRHEQYIETPYVKQEYENRIIFSNKHVTDEFVNGYRTFQGLSYQDYDKKYGPIVKLEPWGNNLFCVFEHGLAILPVNEKALLQTTTEQTIHIYGHGVLPEQMSIVSQDYGSRYSDTVLRTPIGIYGVDTDAKKIWRFSDKQGFETLSDMKIETYLNNNLAARYNIDIDTCDIRTHYNSFKGDVMFTWYTVKDESEIEICSICYNERQGMWTTRYDWTPLVSENSNGEFYSLQRGKDSIIEDGHYIDKVGIYSHSTIDKNKNTNSSEARPTKWYGEQHPFEFEIVVSDPIGVMKIFENLQIVSNNVQPEELQFEFIGDSYFFNKARVYHTVFENKFSDRRRWGNEVTRNLKLYLTDPSRREDDNSIRVYNKPNIIMNQNENDYHPFRNASILNDRNNQPLFGEVIKTDNSTEEYRLRIPQECRNIETWGRRLGNMHYKEGVWTTTIEPVIYDARLNNPIITTFNTQATKWNSARIRDKWCKIRIRYSGEDLAVITAIKTMLNV